MRASITRVISQIARRDECVRDLSSKRVFVWVCGVETTPELNSSFQPLQTDVRKQVLLLFQRVRQRRKERLAIKKSVLRPITAMTAANMLIQQTQVKIQCKSFTMNHNPWLFFQSLPYMTHLIFALNTPRICMFVNLCRVCVRVCVYACLSCGRMWSANIEVNQTRVQ